MDIINLLTFIVLSILLVLSPGPNGILIAKTVPLSGQKAGFANIWGFFTAFYIHGTLAIYGISIILVQSSQAFFLFKLIGALYLLYIGIKVLMDVFKNEKKKVIKQEKTEKEIKTISKAYIEGLLTNVLNPKVSMFYLAAFPQFLSFDSSTLDAYLLVSVHALINLIWFSLMVIFLIRVKLMTKSFIFLKILKSITGIAFIAFAIKLILLKPIKNAS